MSRHGTIYINCDADDCYEVVSYGPSSIFEGEVVRTAVGWKRKDDRDYCPVCCQEENPREKGDDDGVEYADPRDHMKGIE